MRRKHGAWLRLLPLLIQAQLGPASSEILQHMFLKKEAMLKAVMGGISQHCQTILNKIIQLHKTAERNKTL